MNRKKRAELARETLSIIEKGFYISPDNQTVDIRSDLEKCRRGTVVYDDEQASGFDPVPQPPSHGAENVIDVTRETTLDAAYRLKKQMPDRHIVCLNFASAKNPGGGFLGGSQAQEESLARSSALYAAIEDRERYYGYHRRLDTSLYSDRMIFSPGVPSFSFRLRPFGRMQQQFLGAGFIADRFH